MKLEIINKTRLMPLLHMKKSEPSLLELATGAGKSLIVAAIAQWVT